MNTRIRKDIQPLKHILLEQGLLLDPLCAFYWENRKTLIVSDLHMGKSAHFRKNGTPLPGIIGDNNLWNLSMLVDKYDPERVLLLGDLFHSAHNHEWEQFNDMALNYSQCEWLLVKGNHDILDEHMYDSSTLNVVNTLQDGPFFFAHEPEDLDPEKGYGFAGHIHPCVRLSGRANQSMRLKCFWFRKEYAIVPAFGDFTGSHRVKPIKSDKVFVVTGSKVCEV